MPRSHSHRRDSTHSSIRTNFTRGEQKEVDEAERKLQRIASVYDAVAGRVGLNGFLGHEQRLSPNVMPSLPEEVLLRRVGAPEQIPHDYYNADERLAADQKLPDSDLLKALHTYASDYFAATTFERGVKDFRGFDGTALLALGSILEEASKEALGENGDMALVEPMGLKNGLPESKMTKYQIVGKVKSRNIQELSLPHGESGDSDDLENMQAPRKRRRART